MSKPTTPRRGAASPLRADRETVASPALLDRLAALVGRGKKGDLFDAPETLAVLFELAALMLMDDSRHDALELAAWYAEEAALDGPADPADVPTAAPASGSGRKGVRS